ncbi:MAG: hypothetical protein NUV73_02850 [Candidatus Daviesbacteria bacterium]|nr:hypothetical protein [Candidatus Daviesbacteria bacterium]
MKTILLVLITVFLVLPGSVLAVEGRIEELFEQRIERDDARVRIEIKQRIRQDNESVDALEIREGVGQKVEIQGNRFEITGRISDISGDNFTIAGNTIFIDPSLVREFEQKGALRVDEGAKVEGIIVGNKKFAEEIKVFHDQEEVDIRVKQAQETRIRTQGAIENLNDLLNRILSFLRSL